MKIFGSCFTGQNMGEETQKHIQEQDIAKHIRVIREVITQENFGEKKEFSLDVYQIKLSKYRDYLSKKHHELEESRLSTSFSEGRDSISFFAETSERSILERKDTPVPKDTINQQKISNFFSQSTCIRKYQKGEIITSKDLREEEKKIAKKFSPESKQDEKVKSFLLLWFQTLYTSQKEDADHLYVRLPTLKVNKETKQIHFIPLKA